MRPYRLNGLGQKGRSIWRLHTLLCIMICIIGGAVLIYDVLGIQSYTAYTVSSFYRDHPQGKAVIFTEEKRQPGFLLRTPGCSTPDMDAMDASIKEYIFKENEVICNGGVPALVDSNATSLYLLESSLVHYDINDTNLLSCCYQPFHRLNPKNTYSDMQVKFDKLCYDFKWSVDVIHEFVRVECKYNKTDIYKDFFNFVPLKNVRVVRDVPRDYLNVLLIGLDSISRLNFIRQMPKTIGILEELGAVEMLGFNKVGDNTFPNLVPLLTGMTADELQENCWPNRTSYFDACPFVWKQFEEAGYTTAFAEDAAWMGLFHYTMNGFKHQPTDYFYGHWDYMAADQIGNMLRGAAHLCLGAKATYKALLDYTEKFTRTMREHSRPYFGFFWQSSLSHDYLNRPQLDDKNYHDLLSNLNSTGVLNNTVLIFMSDHGIRWGDIRSTYQGRMEERMPFLYVQLPNWFKQRNSVLYNNLRTNRNRLTTHFDIHETIKDLINSHELTDQFITARSSHQVLQRGYSLFSKITVNRSCDDAGIATHWCTCQTSRKVAVNDTAVIDAANYMVHEHLNKILAGNAECATLQLDGITDASIQVNTDTLPKLDSQFYQDYTITLRTKPGGGIFEATLRKGNDEARNHFKVTGTVSRINTYGKQSDCITNSRLKLYCYCRHYLTD